MGQINQATCTKFGTAVSTNICSKEQEQTGVGGTTILQLIWTSSLKATVFFLFWDPNHHTYNTMQQIAHIPSERPGKNLKN